MFPPVRLVPFPCLEGPPPWNRHEIPNSTGGTSEYCPTLRKGAFFVKTLPQTSSASPKPHPSKPHPYNPGGHLKKCRSPGQEKCRKSASESAGPKRGASESAPGLRAYVEVVYETGPGELFSALSEAPRFGPALSEALFRHFSWPGLRHFFRWSPRL